MATSDKAHTIILLQLGDKASRTYMDFNTVPAAMDAVCGMFESRLKELNPMMTQITYDIQDLFAYIDRAPDLSALVFDNATNTYIPCNKSWVKEQALKHLQRQAGNAVGRRR